MANKITQTISNAPTAPDRNDPSTFPDRADAFVAYIEDMDDEYNAFASQANALATEAEVNADTAETKASEAAASADAAASASNASPWDSSTTYSKNDVAIGSDYNSYRSKTNSNLNNDPVTDEGTNWRNITQEPAVLFISSATASSDLSIDFTAIDSSFSSILVVFNSVLPDTNNVDLVMRVSSDGGSTWDSGATDYAWRDNFTNDDADASVRVSSSADSGGSGVSGRAGVFNINTANNTSIASFTMQINGGGFADRLSAVGSRKSTNSDDSIQFFFKSGNISSGRIDLYGVE